MKVLDDDFDRISPGFTARALVNLNCRRIHDYPAPTDFQYEEYRAPATNLHVLALRAVSPPREVVGVMALRQGARLPTQGGTTPTYTTMEVRHVWREGAAAKGFTDTAYLQWAVGKAHVVVSDAKQTSAGKRMWARLVEQSSIPAAVHAFVVEDIRSPVGNYIPAKDMLDSAWNGSGHTRLLLSHRDLTQVC